MGHEISNIGQNNETQKKTKSAYLEDFVLEKSIFNNVFEKDIRRVYIYKKAERLAKALHLITPAFAESVSLKNRIDTLAIGLIDAATLPPNVALSRELLALSSLLSVARTGGFLSTMNTELIVREVHLLLQEVASYEEPRLFLDEVPTLSAIAKRALAQENQQPTETHQMPHTTQARQTPKNRAQEYKGHIKDKGEIKDRQKTLLSVLKNKQKASIKDISTLIKGVSEKTIQRELAALIEAGMVQKQGERRWSTYSLAS